MALDPNIPLMARPTDVATGLMQGFQIARGIQQARQEAELQPYRQALLQAQAQAAPIVVETQRIQNLTAQQKLGVQGAALAAQKALPFLQSGDMAGLKTFIQGTNLLDDQDKAAMSAKIDANDLQGIIGDVSGAIGLAQQMGIFEVPKTERESDVLTKLRAAGIEPGSEAARQALFPPQAQAPVSNEILKQKDVKDKIDIALADLNNLRDQKLVNEKDYQFLKGQLNVGQFDSYAGALRNIAGQVPSTDAQTAARNAEAGAAMVNFAADKQRVVQGAKDLQAIKTDYFKQRATAISMRNLYEQGLKQLEAGAGTGFLESRLPNFTNAAALLENVRQQIGLTLLSDAGLTPVSNADLQVLLNAAIPFEAGEEAVKQWVKDKIAAYDKLIPVLDKGVDHFERGKSMSSWLDESTWNKKASPTPGASDVPGAVTPAAAPTSAPNLNAPVDLVYDRASKTWVSPGGRR